MDYYKSLTLLNQCYAKKRLYSYDNYFRLIDCLGEPSPLRQKASVSDSMPGVGEVRSQKSEKLTVLFLHIRNKQESLYI